MRNGSCQQGENKRDREPKKKNRTGTQATFFFFVTTYDISFIKRELGSFTL